MFKLVVVRHGESIWNQENRFTGWKDVELSAKGMNEATLAGRSLARAGFEFDEAYTSVLKRAILTLEIILKEMDLLWIPVTKDWRLNERHYGALQGLNKAETAALHGEEQVKIWRRSYNTPPPMMNLTDSGHPMFDKKYKNIDPKVLPSGEALSDTVKRFLPLWNHEMALKIKKGRKILISAHGNSIRALIQHLEGLTPEQIMEVNVPTGIPLVYELDNDLKVLSKNYLGDPDVIKAAMEHVASQGKRK
ncbi:MAG: 2,3-diphosphoglycerate-dependent phosphoglycerate mutase [Oligoflexia bacterium]|nr:2,3-diphosphoglycerate-dependent phosphoglycerate mutase [Oligoflexia bacterium]